jgi:hypothetical protein
VTGAPEWSWRGARSWLAIGASALGTGAILGYLIAHEPVQEVGTPPPRSNGSRSDLALLSPLHEGSRLGSFEVAEIRPIGDDGVLQLVLHKGRAEVRLSVALASDGGPSPPASAGRYSVFYAVDHADNAAKSAEGEELASALATILRANEGVPAPPRLAPFDGHR